MRLIVICILAASLICTSGAAQELDPQPTPEYLKIRRAFFFNIHAARLSAATTPGVAEALGNLRPDLFSSAARAKIITEFKELCGLKMRWLQENRTKYGEWKAQEVHRVAREDADREARRLEAQNNVDMHRHEEQVGAPYFPRAAVLPFRAVLPAPIRKVVDEQVTVDSVEEELDYLWAGAQGPELDLSSESRSRLVALASREIDKAVNEKFGWLGPTLTKRPDVGFQVVRRAVFLHIGQIGGDPALLKAALQQLQHYELVRANTERVIADFPRILRWRKTWLDRVVREIDASAQESVVIPLPEEVAIDVGGSNVATNVEVRRKDRGRFRYERELLETESDAKRREMLSRRIQAERILDALE